MDISFKDEKIHKIIHQRSNIGQCEMLYGKCGVAKTWLTALSYTILARNKNQPEEIDSVIVAELPDLQNNPVLYDIVILNMVHGQEHNLAVPCIKNGICAKKHPD